MSTRKKIKKEQILISKLDDCSICLERLLHPCKLQCGHVFCFLCIKGFLLQSSECALCRCKIRSNYSVKPEQMKEVASGDLDASIKSEGYVWFYKGNKGWWQYDERTNACLELEFMKKTKKFEVLIAGRLYTIDFENFAQTRSDNFSLKRSIKRELSTNNGLRIKGIAGLYKQYCSKE